MGTSGARFTASAFEDDPTTTITDAAPARFLRLLRFLRLDLSHWEANQSVQRTGASRHAEWRCGRRRRLAPVADLCVRQPRSRQGQTGTSPGFLGQDEQDLQDGSDDGERQEGSCPSCYPVQTPGSFFSSGSVYQDWLAGSFPPEVPMTSVEPGGPANGPQPARRVAWRMSRVAGSRR